MTACDMYRMEKTQNHEVARGYGHLVTLTLLVNMNIYQQEKESIFLFSRYKCRGLGPS